MMEDQQTQAMTGYPWLAQIPILKYLFGQDTRDHSENETVFVLIPHIVRKQEISELNQEALDVGTASAIELHRVSRPQVAPASENTTPVPAPNQQPAASPHAAAPVTSPQPASPQPPGSAGFSFDPPAIAQPPGSTFTVNVLVAGAQNAYSVPLQVTYNPKLLQVVNVSNGTFLSQDGQAVALVHREDDSTGTIQITATRPPGANGVSGQGTVVTLTFMAKSAGQSTLAISKGGTRDPNMQPTLVAGASAAVDIR